MFFTDPGPEGDTGLHNPLGSVFVLTGRILRPIALRCLAYPTGIALSPTESALFVAEAAANRVLRYTQKPLGVWHGTVFHQFSGRLGPTALVVDRVRELIYVARPEVPEMGGGSAVAVLSLGGECLKEFVVDGMGSGVTSLALTPDGKELVVADAATNTILSITL